MKRIGSVAGIALAVIQPAFAADRAIDEIIVSAGFEPIERGEAIGSVTVIDRDAIERSQARFVADLLRAVPGFSISQSGGIGAQSQLRVRGGEANHLLVLVDGVRANDPAQDSEYQLQYALAADVERIEIIRGPQSAIWGTDALSGVINIIRRRESDSGFVNADAESGSFGSRTLSFSAGTGGGRWQLSGGASRFSSDGTNVSRSGNEDDGAENLTADLKLDADLTEALTLALSAQYVTAENEFDAIDFFVTGLPTDADRITEADRQYFSGELRHAPVDSRWANTLRINRLSTTNDNFSDGQADGSTAADSLEFQAQSSVRFSSGSNVDHRLSFVVDHETTDFEQRGTASFFGDPNQDQSFDVTGYAFEYLVEPGDRIMLNVSGRLDDFSDFDDATSFRLGAAVRATSRLRVHASVGSGSKAPTFIERFGFFPNSFAGNPDLKPETSLAWEIGVTSALAGDRVRWAMTWFEQDLQDEIDGFVFDPASGLFTARNRTADSERRGIEFNADAEITGSLSTSFAWTWTDATERDASGIEQAELRRPEHVGSFALHYSFAQSRARIDLGVSYNGDQEDIFFSPSTFVSERVDIANYAVARLAASWQATPSLQFYVRAENLLDDEHEEVLGFARPGRGIYAGLRGRFAL